MEFIQNTRHCRDAEGLAWFKEHCKTFKVKIIEVVPHTSGGFDVVHLVKKWEEK